jgi:trans-aconitate methyltransferase
MLRNRTLVGVALALIAALAVASTGAQPLKPLDKEPEVPYVPTHERIVAEMLKVAKVGKSDVLYDLGSGDGRIVITAAKKFGTRGVGVDVDPVRVKEARENAAKAGVADRVKFLQQDLFETDIREATVVTLYLLPEVNLRLRPKLLSELKPGTRVVSHNYDMGDWTPLKTLQVRVPEDHTIYYWVVPPPGAGR